MRVSANLGFLWKDLPPADAIRAAAAAGFDAVEMHWPQAHDPAPIRAALERTGLPLVSLNTERGDVAAGDLGLSAVPGREAEARALIDRAMESAARLGAGQVHVMAGRAEGAAAHRAFLAALSHACEAAEARGIGVLIEPINPHDMPGYFLSSVEQALGIIAELSLPNLRLMFDCYHVQRISGDVTRRLEAAFPQIGHVQIAAAPHRGRPDGGELDLSFVLSRLAALGWDRPVGAEYIPEGAVEDGLGWLPAFQRI